MKLIKCKFLCLRSSTSSHFEKNLKVTLTLCFGLTTLAGSYVALTVLGRPPGLAQIPLSEAESEMLGVSISSPNSPAAERPYSPQDRFSSTLPSWVHHLLELPSFKVLPPQIPSTSSFLMSKVCLNAPHLQSNAHFLYEFQFPF